MTLDSAVTAVPKVRPVDAKRLAALGILTVRDLLLRLPFGWDQFGDPKPIAALEDGAQATVTGTILNIAAKISKYKKLKLTQATLVDGADDELKLVCFN